MDDDVYLLPVTSAQRGMWLTDQFAPGGTAYVVPCRVRIDGPVDVPMLASALAIVMDRHETLRTTFRTVDGHPMQVIAPGAVIPMPYEDVRSQPAAAEDRFATIAGTPFDLETGPLLRTALLRLSDDVYELMFAVHHIVADGWSVTLLCGELAAAYDGLVAGHEPKLPDLPIQYGDYALWENDRSFASGEAYWRTAIAGAPQVVTLPTDRVRPTEPRGRGATAEFVIDAATTVGLREIARTGGATMFMTLLSLYAAVLSRYAGTEDLLVGVPVAARTRTETEHLIGLFSNTLPLRIRTGDNATFAELVDRVRAATAAGLAHQDTPFERIMEAVAPDRSIGHSPLVQVLFAVVDEPDTIDAGPVTFRPTIVGNGTSKVDLSLGMRDDGVTIAGRLTYDTDLFEPGTAELFVDALCAAADAVVADPRTPLADVDLVRPGHRARILNEWGTGPALGGIDGGGTDDGGDLVEMLLHALDGDKPAVIAGDTSLRRHDVAHWAGQIAAALIAAGVGPDSTVGLCLPRGAGLVPAMLGAWMAGAAYVPLDPAYPAGRLRIMAADSGIRVVLTQSSLAGLVRSVVGGVTSGGVASGGSASAGVTVVRVDAPEVRTGSPATAVPTSPDALAYTIFTSGSTGRPKGVGVPRAAVAALLRAFALTLDVSEADTWAAVTTLSFDIAVLELLFPLVVGAVVVVADAPTAADGVLLRRLLQTSGATVLQATPATWRMLALVGGVPASVRLRLCGGEAVPPDVVDELTSGGAEAWNVYGPTETTVWSAAGRLRSGAVVEVGPPIPGTRLLVLDARLRPVPPGVVGEVYIAGAGLARGYVGRAGLTAERFLPDPYAPVPGGRMYRTGDLARWRPSGRLDLLGRVDHQVKVRGFRIETGEIETVLSRHDSVAHAVVTAQAGNLVAYVVPRGAAADAAVLRRHLQGFLPDYMIPAAFVVLDELPLTPNGKIDRAGLPQPEWGDGSATGYAPPVTPTQQRLADVWAELLPGTKQIGIHQNFFTLGGHSLIAIQLVARIQSEYGVKLSLRTLFANVTVAELATVVESTLAGTATGGDAVAVAARELGDIDMDDLLGSLS